MSTTVESSPRHLGFFLVPEFTLLAFSSAIEPLRMANRMSGKELYRWSVISEDGKAVQASDGMRLAADYSIKDEIEFDTIIVCGGIDIDRFDSQGVSHWLARRSRHGAKLGGICTGSYVLARAGLLDNYVCTIHWEHLGSWTEQFPRINSSDKVYCIDRDRMTSSGGTAPMDMMLKLISMEHGKELIASISEVFVYDRIRDGSDLQRVPLKHIVGNTQPKLQEIVALMEANIEETIGLDELAEYVNLSRRQLERLFQKYLNCSPSRYYVNLRLMRARQLLKQTTMSIIEVAVACGFVSTPHFSGCYRNFFGMPPRDERIGLVASNGAMAQLSCNSRANPVVAGVR
jgi:AraC family transcriptional regulator, glycine betaine-responsive activator